MDPNQQNNSIQPGKDVLEDNKSLPIYVYAPFYIVGLVLVLSVFIFEKQWFYLAHPSEHFETPNPAFNQSESNSVGPEVAAAMLPESYEPESKPYDIEVCNSSNIEKLYVSLAYFNPVSKAWVARGWFVSHKGECLVPLKNVKPPVYAYAESINGTIRWGESKNANTHAKFCIDRSNKYTYPRGRCEVSKYDSMDSDIALTKTDWQSFKKLKVSGTGGVFTWELAEP